MDAGRKLCLSVHHAKVDRPWRSSPGDRRQRHVLVVGLTGGIGSGKSLVAALFARRGAFVIDADQLAREAVEVGTEALRAIASNFGSRVLHPDGSLDRRALGVIVFADERARQVLNAIVHPRVSELARGRIAQARTEGADIVIYDVPLLFENGLERGLDAVIVVEVDRATQRARLAARDGLDLPEIDRRIASQMPLEEKVARADYVVDNRGTKDATEAQVERIWSSLLKRARALSLHEGFHGGARSTGGRGEE